MTCPPTRKAACTTDRLWERPRYSDGATPRLLFCVPLPCATDRPGSMLCASFICCHSVLCASCFHALDCQRLLKGRGACYSCSSVYCPHCGLWPQAGKPPHGAFLVLDEALEPQRESRSSNGQVGAAFAYCSYFISCSHVAAQNG